MTKHKTESQDSLVREILQEAEDRVNEAWEYLPQYLDDAEQHEELCAQATALETIAGQVARGELSVSDGRAALNRTLEETDR